MNNYIDLMDLETTTDLGKDGIYIITADDHIGNIYENLNNAEMINKFANYNNIKCNIHCGDLLEGLIAKEYANYKTYETQIEHFINDYPKDNSIKNYYIYGNHDLDFIDHHVDLKKELSVRKDFIYMGSMYANIEANNVHFIVKHSSILNNFDEKEKPITFQGHGHIYGLKEKRRTFFVPTISDVAPGNKFIEPGFLVLEVKDDMAYITNYVITNEPHKDETISYKVKTLGSKK